MTLDCAGLVSRRQQIRAKEDRSLHGNDAAAPQQPKQQLKTKKKLPVSSESSSAATATNAADHSNVMLLIRQVLQRPHYGDMKAYLKTATKEQVFEQTLRLATFAHEARVIVDVEKLDAE
ncbi:hypothetical protein FI667_g12289, partial [Globisporangium splendens]